MQNKDPYAPPRSSLGGTTLAEQHDRDNGVLRYASVWQRLGAALIDVIVFVPFLGIDYFSGESRFYELYVFVPEQVFSVFIYIYMAVKYGGSPGKLAMGLRIVKVDGSAVTLKAALLRYSVPWCLATLISALTIGAALGMTDETYRALDYFARSDAMDARSPHILTVTYLLLAWYVASLVYMFVDNKRRALHDLVAGTVIVLK